MSTVHVYVVGDTHCAYWELYGVKLRMLRNLWGENAHNEKFMGWHRAYWEIYGVELHILPTTYIRGF